MKITIIFFCVCAGKDMYDAIDDDNEKPDPKIIVSVCSKCNDMGESC